MRPRTIISFAALCTVPFVLVLSNSMLIPVLPKMRSVMDLSLLQAGLIVTAFSIPAGIVIPFAGYISDQVGRKLIMIPALVVFGTGGVLAGLAASFLSKPYYFILLGRVIQGIGGGGTYQLAMALAGDVFQSEERSKALGILEASNGLGKVVAPLIGAATALIVWYAPFFVYGVLAFAAALLIWFFCQDPAKNKKKQSYRVYIKSLKEIADKKGKGLAVCFLAGMLAIFLFFFVLSYFSDLLEGKYHVTGFIAGLMIAGPVLAMAVTSYIIGTVLQKQLSKLLKPATIAGLLLQAISLFILALVKNRYYFSGGVIMLGIGNGILLPAVNMLITSAALQERGLVTALYGTVRFFGAALGPPATGVGIKYGQPAMFITAASVSAIAAGLNMVLLKEKEMLPEEFLQKE